MQSELPLWSSGLESLGYSDPFPKFSRKTLPSYDQMEDDSQDFSVKSGLELSGTEEEKGWKFYIGSICNRRTTNDLLADMWRQGEKGWTKDIPDLLKRSAAAENVVTSWYNFPFSFSRAPRRSIHTLTRTPTQRLTQKNRYRISLAGIQSPKDNPDLMFFFRGRFHMALERIYRPAFYLAMHFQTMPTFIKQDNELWLQVFNLAQKAVDNCVQLIPNYYYQFRHEWIWNVIRASFSCALHIIGVVLYQLEASRAPRIWQLRVPPNWAGLVRVSLRTLKHWAAESIDIEIMRSTLERMYQGTCRLANVRPDLHLL